MLLAFHDPSTLEKLALDPEELPWDGMGRLAIVPGTNRLVLLPVPVGAPLRADAVVRYRDLTPPALPAASPPRLEGDLVDRAHPLEPWEQPLRLVQGAPLAGAVPMSPGVAWDAGAGVLRWTPTLEQLGPQVVKVALQRAGLPDAAMELAVNVAYREVGLEGSWSARTLADGKVVAAKLTSVHEPFAEPCVVVLDPTAGRSTARLPAGVVEHCWVGTTLWLVLAARDAPELLAFEAPSLTPRRWPLAGGAEARPSRLAEHPSGQLTWLGQVEDEWRLYRLDPVTSSLRSAPFPGGEPGDDFEWRSATAFVCGGRWYAWEGNAVTILQGAPPDTSWPGRMTALAAPSGRGLIARIRGADGAERGSVTYPWLDPVQPEVVVIGGADRRLLLSAGGAVDTRTRLYALPFDPSTVR